MWAQTRRTRVGLGTLLLTLLLAACRGREDGLFIVAPFNDETKIAAVQASWRPIGDPSGAPDRVSYEVRVENRLADRLYVRLEDFALKDAAGRTIARGQTKRACVLAPHAAQVVLKGELSLPPGVGIAAFDVARFGVPLSERGRGIYREFVLQSPVKTPAAVDAEIAAYMSAEPCE